MSNVMTLFLRRSALLALAVAAAISVPFETSAQTGWKIEPLVTGLDTPWAVAPLPEGGALITERGGDLILAKEGRTSRIGGVPKVVVKGQGGLLDITLARDFAQSRLLFLTYAKRQPSGGSGTALARAEFPLGANRLQNVTEIFAMKPGSKGGRHFGSRVVEGRDGTLFVTIGDRGQGEAAQDLSRHQGTIIRVNKDGSIPADNPFVKSDLALPEIWSYGHRNPQGAALDRSGNLWTAEHGAKGGDEINAVRKGANFGWPVISYGKHYSGAKIGEGTRKQGMEQPRYYWDPSMAPSGLLIYDGAAFGSWRGDLFVGSLKFDYISRLSGNPLREVEQIKTPDTNRVRDIVAGPSGAIWFISAGNGTLYRIVPD